MLKVTAVGAGKMGLSHIAILRSHPQVELVGISDSVGFLLSVLGKYTDLQTFSSVEKMLEQVDADAIVIATPSASHAALVRFALERGLHVFCEKPLTLSPEESNSLASLATRKGVVTQVGYHNRFVGTFQEVKRLLAAHAIGSVTHVLAEAYGPVVLHRQGTTWRAKKSSGGGALYDYAAHPLNLLTWFFGPVLDVPSATMKRVFSAETDDQVFGALTFDDGITGQLSVDWSDESYRRMMTRLTIRGTAGIITVDHQECYVYLRERAGLPGGYVHGWNVRNTAALTAPVWFNLRGEEYSAQLAHFVEAAVAGDAADHTNDFASAAITDAGIRMLVESAEGQLAPRPTASAENHPAHHPWSRHAARRAG